MMWLFLYRLFQTTFNNKNKGLYKLTVRRRFLGSLTGNVLSRIPSIAVRFILCPFHTIGVHAVDWIPFLEIMLMESNLSMSCNASTNCNKGDPFR